VHTYAAAETNKGDGGPTCLTRPLLRAQQSSPPESRHLPRR